MNRLTTLSKLIGIIGATIISMSTLSACTQSANLSQAHNNILTYLEPNTFKTLYPPSAGYYPNGGIINQITDRLLYQDPDTLELSPWIATELPEVNADATQYTFHIRTDVTYSDGTKLTPENVVKNFDLYARGDKARKLTASEQINNYERGEVIDDHTVRFHFSAPAPGFAQATSSFNAGLLSDATLDKTTEGFAPGQATSIIGSGPFSITEEKLDTSLMLSTRKDYNWAPPVLKHQGRAQIDGIRYVLAAEDSVRIGGLLAGQADIARQIEAPVEKHLTQAGLTVQAHSTGGMSNQLALRFRHPFLQDIRVRQAIFAGIDRKEILRTLFSPRYALATSAMDSHGLGYARQADYIYDPNKARSLLDEAGWVPGPDGIRVKDGQRLSFTVNEALPQPRSREVITKVQEQLAKIGIEIHLLPGDIAVQDADSKDITKVQIRHTMVGRADYDVIKSQYYSTNRNQLLNYDEKTDSLGDPELEELLNQVASSPKEQDRAAASAKVQQLLYDKAYVLPLFEEPQVYGLHNYVKGFHQDAIGRPVFYETWIDHKELAQ
ncbi:TIGR04028 family ABC transporter substrate-binding protein [Corynebacterium sp. sy039]|uniref:TIGR04028 family ABC transporter substrate-binding protein n=1 Tax=Corynebacterium sp. sy039 TaxID=2599641 RepID=UPI0011B73AE7|nr:TIGR04028 family ABC transporter substrate-binding protein [Corynebacterium sp. sy039]QDZ41957.1 TIGR04028 family ABC transporter substrate-binding protein [Corynebacterium sp. sy039]